MDYRKLQIGMVIIFWALLFTNVENNEKRYITRIDQETIIIPSISKEYKFLYIADTHLIGMEQNEENNHANDRRLVFVNENNISSYDVFPYIIRKANKKKYDALLMGGDIIDFPSGENINYLQENINKLKIPYLYAVGNHDFTYPWEYFTEKAYQEYLPLLNPLKVNEMGCEAFELEDVIIVAIDNSTDQINENSLKKLKSYLKKDKPVIIMLHVPIELEENSNVVAILAGHTHFYHKDKLNNNIIQIITDATYKGGIMEITVKPK